jgi:hypothetical protein
MGSAQIEYVSPQEQLYHDVSRWECFFVSISWLIVEVNNVN